MLQMYRRTPVVLFTTGNKKQTIFEFSIGKPGTDTDFTYDRDDLHEQIAGFVRWVRNSIADFTFGQERQIALGWRVSELMLARDFINYTYKHKNENTDIVRLFAIYQDDSIRYALQFIEDQHIHPYNLNIDTYCTKVVLHPVTQLMAAGLEYRSSFILNFPTDKNIGYLKTLADDGFYVNDVMRGFEHFQKVISMACTHLSTKVYNDYVASLVKSNMSIKDASKITAPYIEGEAIFSEMKTQFISAISSNIEGRLSIIGRDTPPDEECLGHMYVVDTRLILGGNLTTPTLKFKSEIYTQSTGKTEVSGPYTHYLHFWANETDWSPSSNVNN